MPPLTTCVSSRSSHADRSCDAANESKQDQVENGIHSEGTDAKLIFKNGELMLYRHSRLIK